MKKGGLFFTCIIAAFITAFADDDAQYVRCIIPDTVITDEVFEAHITFYNNGTTAWGSETPATLVSRNPAYTQRWGTWLIIIGQHTSSVNPGDTFTFVSRLKAPPDTGLHSFCWQIQRWGQSPVFDTTTPFFGDSVIGEYIYVKPRLETPPLPVAHVDSILDSSDIEYMGSFLLPGLGCCESRWSESGLTFKTTGGEKHLLVRTGTYDSYIYEMTIPPLIKITDNTSAGLNTGSVVRDWGEFSFGTVNNEPLWANCGFWFDDRSQILYWGHYHSYYVGGPDGFPQLLATRLNANGTKDNIDYWYLPGDQGPYKSYYGGPIKLSQRFAQLYTGGRELGMGFGGYYSICGSASRGPALGAMALPDTSESVLDLVGMMSYPETSPSIRRGDYLPVVEYWNDIPPSPWEGKWTYGDACRAGIFVDLPDKKGYLAFVHHVVGRIGYDYGGGNTDGHSRQYWYFYELNTLGSVAQGEMPRDSVKPRTLNYFDYFIPGFDETYVTGACFDSSSRMFYVYVMTGKEDRGPIIHAFRIKEGSSYSEAVPGIRNQDLELTVSPNPFNPRTMISLNAVQRGGELSLFSLDGKCVFSMANTPQTVMFDGSKLHSGVYIVRYIIGSTALSEKMTLLK